MHTVTAEGNKKPVKQISVFADNKVGRLNDLLNKLSQQDIHVVAISAIDATDCAVLRIIVDYPEAAVELLREQGFVFTESHVLAVEVKSAGTLQEITRALLMCEINIHYVYPFLIRPHGESALAMHIEDIDLAASILQERGIRVLNQADITR